MKLRTRSASCQMSSYCCWVIGMTICLAPRGTCVEGVFRSRSTCRVFGRASILASPSLERSRMTKMPPAGYPAFLQYLQSGRVRGFVIKATGNTVLVMTNRHVVVPEEGELPEGAKFEISVVFR